MRRWIIFKMKNEEVKNLIPEKLHFLLSSCQRASVLTLTLTWPWPWPWPWPWTWPDPDPDRGPHWFLPAASWAKVIFSQVSVYPQGGGVSASVHAGIYPPGSDTNPPGPDPSGADTPQSRHPPLPSPGSRPPWEQTPPPGADTTPQSRHPPPRSGHHPPEQTPRSRHHPGADTTTPHPPPPTQGIRLQHTVNERPVRFLLECILVTCTTHTERQRHTSSQVLTLTSTLMLTQTLNLARA